MSHRFQQVRRPALAALIGAGLIAAAGWIVEVWWLGASADSSYARVQAAVQHDFRTAERSLALVAAGVAGHPDVAASFGRQDARGRLFEITREHVAQLQDPDLSVTVFAAGHFARAWTGRPSNVSLDPMPTERLIFVSAGVRELRLVHVEPLTITEDGDSRPRRAGAVVAERVLSATPSIVGSSHGGFRVSTPIADVTLRPHQDDVVVSHPYRFVLEAEGQVLLEAEVLPGDLDQTRADWRRVVLTTGLVFLAGLVLVSSGTLLTRPLTAGTPRQRDAAVSAGGAAIGSLCAFGLLRLASTVVPARFSLIDPSTYRSVGLGGVLRHPVDLLLGGLLVLGLVVVATYAVERTRLGGYAGRQPLADRPTRGFLLAQLSGGVLATVALWGLDRLIGDTFQNASVDLLHTSLQPWDSGRVTLLAGVLLVSAATFWGVALTFSSVRLPWTTRHASRRVHLLTAAVWCAPAVALTFGGLLPPLGTLPLLVGAAAAALAMPSMRPRFRHGSNAGRLLALLTTVLVPALLTYPSLLHHGEETKRRYVETQHAIRAASHSEEMQGALTVALGQLDDIVAGDPSTRWDDAAFGPGPDRAFELWRQTELASQRLTSSVELYRVGGTLISRFNLNLPEYGRVPLGRQVAGCEWDVFGEIVPFGSIERRVLHAERALCVSSEDRGVATHDRRQAVGSVVVHVAFDYQTLPFISPENPYTELLGPAPRPQIQDRAGQDVELVVYGWGLQPVFSSSQDAWSIDERLFDRIYASRTPFWTTLTKGGRAYTAFVANNREGIYVVGYPTHRVFDHLVRMAEIATVVALLFVALVAASLAGGWLTPDRYRFGRALLGEVRSSFYRRLLLAFIAATLVPLLALAFVIRNYVTAQLRADVEAGAAQTAIVAQRVIEGSLDQVEALPTAALVNDDLMVWINHVLDQEVNIFVGSQLVATSERPLFASGLLPTRTPDAVYTAIALEHLPTFVMEDSVGSLQYVVAAAPLRALGPEAVLTVPLASRQQQIERQIDDLDRGILLGVVVFVLLGAGGGLYLAERIADPVKRLTRATGQIASGDFDAHVAAHSGDELQQLVVSFNRMADDLKRQQIQLEKTHRLEAWAEMARQVAHEIKNPLTPVQLSAEHLLRVHADRGEPLGSVVKSCVDSILTQVRLLRQISSEFSSYATQPTVERRPTSPQELVDAVLKPYLVGLAERIAVAVTVPSSLPMLALDRTLVGRALTNIIENALHAMPASGTLDVRGTRDGDAVVLTVTDTGVGLDPDTLQRIFEPYFSTKVTGTGLGMAIAKRNIELNGGDIQVTSRKDHGTTVTLRFGNADQLAAGNTEGGGSGSSFTSSGVATDDDVSER